MLFDQETAHWHPLLKKKIIHPKELSLFASKARSDKQTLVTLNGSFDLLHAGHLKILSEAHDQKGEKGILIIALNSDESIKQYKSIHRPIVPLWFRLEMMAAICFVDYVTWFEEVDPKSLLSLLKPHVHVNGAEYGPNCIEKEVVEEGGGKIHIVTLRPGLSTSHIIKKIQDERS